MDEFETFQKVLRLFEKGGFSKSSKNKHNYFEVTGFPRYENVMSNVLRFFFDTSEEHNFRDLWLRSLLEIYNEQSPEKVDIALIETKNIEREYSDDTGKRIDLLIDARPLLIVIENKIDAEAYNPFDIYTSMAKNYAEDRNIENYELVKIVLSISPKTIKEETGYINITYEELFKRLDMHWSEYQPDQKWKILAKEFIDNLRREKEIMSMKMDKKWIDFVNANGDNLRALEKRIDNDIDERISICKTINNILNDKEHTSGVYTWANSTYVSQFVTIKMKDGVNICLETYAMKIATYKKFEDYDKLYISIWCRNNRNYDFGYILTALDKQNAKERTTREPGAWGKHYILNEIVLTESFDLNKIASTIKGYIEKIDELNKE